MNNRIIVLVLSVFLITQISAQKELTLEEAVSGQYQQFYPDHVFGFNWIENLNKYSYLKKYQTLVIGEVGGEEKEVLHINDVNEALGVKFNYFAGIKWKDDQTIVLKLRNEIVTFNIETKKGTKIELPENAERITFDNQYNNVAY